jgi:hypothetical protein
LIFALLFNNATGPHVVSKFSPPIPPSSPLPIEEDSLAKGSMAHTIYQAIVTAVNDGRLQEPFSKADFRVKCPGFGAGTYQAFLWKHREGNNAAAYELFSLVAPGRFVCVRPFRYGL